MKHNGKPKAQGGGIDTAIGLELFRRMLRVRKFEERAEALAAAGELPGPVHLYTGQEAVAAGACVALRADDYIVSTHRGHGHVVAKGGDLDRCMAELFARDTGVCRGKGGSMHMADLGLGIIGANGIVGAGMPIALGAALSAKMRGTDQVSVPFFGEGASNEGTFHEALNLAAIWSLPVVFVCENNGYGQLTRAEVVTAVTEIVRRADAYGIPGVRVDGNDCFEVYSEMTRAVAHARAGGGPTLIEAMTYRLREHAEGFEVMFPQIRPPAEIAEWKTRDPIRRHREALVRQGVDEASLDALDSAVESEIDAAVEFARSSPDPAPEAAFVDMWADDRRFLETHAHKTVATVRRDDSSRLKGIPDLGVVDGGTR